MMRVFGWIVVLILFFYAYQVGWFNAVINYFSDSAREARKETVIEYPDGSYTTIKNRNVIDLMFEHFSSKK